jgi:hypothetical protein
MTFTSWAFVEVIMLRNIGIVALLLFLVGHPRASSAQIVVDRVPLPTDVSGLADISALVATVRVRSVKDVTIDVNPGRPPNAYIEYVVDVLDVVKGDDKIAAAGGTTRVFVTGSQRLQERGFRVLPLNEEFLLFLHWRPLLNGYGVTAGPDGVFQIAEGTLRPFGTSPLARNQEGKSVSELVSALRTQVPHQ